MDNNDVKTPEQRPRSRSVAEIARELWHQKPGARVARPEKNLPITTKEIVNGLDHRETLLGIGLTVIAGALAAIGYFYQHASSTKSVHQNATSFLIAMLVGAGMLLVGILLRRRALLGFAAFFFGLEQASFGFFPGGIIYIGFGGWLIWRVMQKQKVDRIAGLHYGTVDTGPRNRPIAATPSKRYTPPKKRRRR